MNLWEVDSAEGQPLCLLYPIKILPFPRRKTRRKALVEAQSDSSRPSSNILNITLPQQLLFVDDH